MDGPPLEGAGVELSIVSGMAGGWSTDRKLSIVQDDDPTIHIVSIHDV
jgi:hypothetical protein